MTLRAVSSIGTSGGGVGLKSAGVLAQSSTPSSVTGTLVETTLATIAIPAGVMGSAGMLRVTTLWSYTNNANNKTLRVVLGGTRFTDVTATTSTSAQTTAMIRNRTAGTQVGFAAAASSVYGTTGAGILTASIDTTIAQSLTITGLLANVGDTITLESYTVELLAP